jgi:hypothetical protein
METGTLDERAATMSTNAMGATTAEPATAGACAGIEARRTGSANYEVRCPVQVR